MPAINFVRLRQKQLSQAEEQDKQYFQIAAIVASIALVALLGVLGYRLYLANQLQQLRTDQQRLRSQIQSQEDREETFVILMNKLQVLAQLLKERKNKQAAIAYFSQVFGDNVLVQDIQYDAGSEVISFGLRTSDVFSLEQAFDVLASSQTLDEFEAVNKTGLRRAENGTYSFNVTVILQESEP